MRLLIFLLAVMALLSAFIIESRLKVPKAQAAFFELANANEITQIDTKATNTYVTLSKLFALHLTMTSIYLQQLYDGKDSTASLNVLETNTEKIAGVFEELYGSEANEQFIKLWKGNIDQYENYAKALKKNDDEGMKKAKIALDEQSNQIGVWIHKIIPTIDDVDMTRIMQEQVQITLLIINAYAVDDQKTLAHQFQGGFEQASQIATFLIRGMMQDKPGAFK